MLAAMKRIKKPLALSRETVRPLASAQLGGVRGAMMNITYGCPTTRCQSAANPASGCTSCPSCGDCGLMKP
jgi:hypothetical protein